MRPDSLRLSRADALKLAWATLVGLVFGFGIGFAFNDHEAAARWRTAFLGCPVQAQPVAAE